MNKSPKKGKSIVVIVWLSWKHVGYVILQLRNGNDLLWHLINVIIEGDVTH